MSSITEIYVLNSTEKNDVPKHLFDIGIEVDLFYDYFYRFKKFIKCPPFQRDYKEYRVNDVICQKTHTDDPKVFRDIVKSVKSDGKTIRMELVREKLSMLQFPSTSDLLYKQYVKKFTFRYNHRVFVNFEISKMQGSPKVYKIYLNVNRDPNGSDTEYEKMIHVVLNVLN